MGQLYTVTMFRENRVYSYDDRGRRVNERLEKIPVVITDLPHCTAIGYQFKFPNQGVSVTLQTGSVDMSPSRAERRDYYESAEEAPTPTKSRDSIVDAAMRGDFGAAISGEAA
jgi:hypothetical protein